MRPVARDQVRAPPRPSARSGSGRPRAAGSASAGSPSGRRRGRRRRARSAARGSGAPSQVIGGHSAAPSQSSSGTTRRTCQVPGSRSPNSTTPPTLQRLDRGQPQAHSRAVPASGDAVVGHLEHERAVAAPDAHGHPGRVGVLVGVADGLGQHRLGQRLERSAGRRPRRRRRTSLPGPGALARAARPRRRTWSASPAARGRAGAGARCADPRAPPGSRSRTAGEPPPADRRRRRAPSRRRTAAGSRLRGSRARGRSAARAGAPSRPAWPRSGRPRPAPRPCRASTAGAAPRRRAAARSAAGRRGSRRSRGPQPPSARTRAGPARGTASAYSAGNWPVMSPSISTTRSSRSDWAAIGADSTVTWAPANCSRSRPCAPAARTRRTRAVVAEDHRPAHPRQPAHRVAQPVVEVVAVRRGVFGLRQDLDEQLERVDPDSRRRAAQSGRPSARTAAPAAVPGTPASSPRSVGIGIRRTDRIRRGRRAIRSRRCAGRSGRPARRSRARRDRRSGTWPCRRA